MIFRKWNIPKINENEVYKTSWVQSTFKIEYKVKTVGFIYSKYVKLIIQYK